MAAYVIFNYSKFSVKVEICSKWMEKETRLAAFYAQRIKGKRKFEVEGEMNIWVSKRFMTYNDKRFACFRCAMSQSRPTLRFLALFFG